MEAMSKYEFPQGGVQIPLSPLSGGLSVMLTREFPGQLPSSHPHHYRVVKIGFAADGEELALYIPMPLFRHGVNIRNKHFVAAAFWHAMHTCPNKFRTSNLLYTVMARFIEEGFKVQDMNTIRPNELVGSFVPDKVAFDLGRKFAGLASSLLLPVDNAPPSGPTPPEVIVITPTDYKNRLGPGKVTKCIRRNSEFLRWLPDDPKDPLTAKIVRALHPDVSFEKWECPICTSGDHEVIHGCNQCDNLFCAACMTRSLESCDGKCPMCRAQLREPLYVEDDEDDAVSDFGAGADFGEDFGVNDFGEDSDNEGLDNDLPVVNMRDHGDVLMNMFPDFSRGDMSDLVGLAAQLDETLHDFVTRMLDAH